MKNKKFSLIIAGSLMALLLAPAISFAEDTTTSGTSATAVISTLTAKELKAKNKFCGTILKSKQSSLKGDKSLNSKLQDLTLEKEAKLLEKKSEKDARVLVNRGKVDSGRAEFVSKLEVKATTDAQKVALIAFKTAVEVATITRRIAVDTALNTYNAGIKSIVDGRKVAVDSILTAYKTLRDAAFAKAELSCANNNVKVTEIKTALNTELKAANNEYNTKKKELAKVGDLIKPFIDARKASTKTAEATFKTAMEKAKSDLKLAFPNLKWKGFSNEAE